MCIYRYYMCVCEGIDSPLIVDFGAHELCTHLWPQLGYLMQRFWVRVCLAPVSMPQRACLKQAWAAGRQD